MKINVILSFDMEKTRGSVCAVYMATSALSVLFYFILFYILFIRCKDCMRPKSFEYTYIYRHLSRYLLHGVLAIYFARKYSSHKKVLPRKSVYTVNFPHSHKVISSLFIHIMHGTSSSLKSVE